MPNQLTDAERIREHVLDEAVRAAKFPSSRKAHYRAMYDRDPAGTKATIASLAPGLPEAQPTATEAYPSSWLTDAERGRAGVANAPPVPSAPHTPSVSAAPPAPVPAAAAPAPTEEPYPAAWLNAEEQARKAGTISPSIVVEA